MKSNLQRLEIWNNGGKVAEAAFKPTDSHVSAKVPLRPDTWPEGTVESVTVRFWPDSPHYIVLEIKTSNK